MTSTAAKMPFESKWTVASGSMKGSVQRLSLSVVVIGRNSDCDIVVVDDPKCSRKHAEAKWTEYGFQIKVLSEMNTLKVNTRPVSSAFLKDGDVVSVGDTDIVFNNAAAMLTASPHAPNPSAARGHLNPVPSHAQPPTGGTQVVYQNKAGGKAQKSNKARIYIYGTIALIGLLFFVGSPSKKKKEITIRTTEQADQDIETAKKLREAADKAHAQQQLNPMSEPGRAKENYVKGFRDYRKGQYERALESFQACLSLSPDDVLCNRYMHLAQRKFDELIQYYMVLGRKYRDQEQYSNCKMAFQNVTFMVKDTSSPIYKEAKENFSACNSMLEGRF